MGLAPRKAKLYLEPSVGFLAGHQALHTESVQGNVSLTPLVSQRLIRQRSHRQAAVPMCRHICVADGITSADVNLLVGGGMSTYHRGRTEERPRTTVGTLDIFLLHIDTFFPFKFSAAQFSPEKLFLTGAFHEMGTIFDCADTPDLPEFQTSFQYAP